MSEETTTTTMARARLCLRCAESRLDANGTIVCTATAEAPRKALCTFLAEDVAGHIRPHFVQADLEVENSTKSRHKGKVEREGGAL
ncbi:MAG: hypothetical protein J5556_00555 [Deltaproteobacteria bacterium]|nr:hypothetical protein [Deltaproteobacteria bacterium]